MPTNQEKQAVWQAYRDRRPTRVPVGYGVNARIVLFNPALNPRGVTFKDYYTDPAATIDIQLAFMQYLAEVVNCYCDGPTGWPTEWAFGVDNQNTYDSAYFGAPVFFREGQVADVEPYLAGAGRDKIFQIDIDHPLDNPFVKHCLWRYEEMKKIAARLDMHGIKFKVNPPVLGFDGHLTIAINLRGGELLSDLYEDPEYALKLMQFIHAGVVSRRRALCELFGIKPFDGLSAGFADDSIALISPEMYREKILPLHRAWYHQWSVQGPHSIHLCGDATRHFPTIKKELNVFSFDTGFPVDHGAVRHALGDDVEIIGGPEVHILRHGTPEQVYQRTLSILKSGVMRGGRFILHEANNLPPCTPEANLEAMYRCCLEHGTYGPPAGGP